ncbi:MAG: DUF58 domain-containing protein [Polyangiaceae bacterium]|nr:DUF58 domain-containing protein [Polyangiaceae bacterium]
MTAAIDWARLTPLGLRARAVADGVQPGLHRSRRRGPGVEFGGHRVYVPGDDLRWLDRHVLMRTGRLLVREFETDTDRALCLLVDATASMGYRSSQAPVSKFEYAAVLAAALSRIAVAGGDAVSLDFIGGLRCPPLPGAGGRAAFDRMVESLEAARVGADLHDDLDAFSRVITGVARRARRGAIVVVLSDLVDLPEGSLEHTLALATSGRTLVVVRVLDPLEALFPFVGPVRLWSTEGSAVVETEGVAARSKYLARLEERRTHWAEGLASRGGSLVDTTSAGDPVAAVGAVLQASARRAW